MRIHLVKTFFILLSKKGFFFVIHKTIKWFLFKIAYAIGIVDQINKRRIFLSNYLDKKYSSTIQHGQFKGLKLSKNPWGITDRGSIIFGIYEKEVSEFLKKIPNSFKDNLINIGASDGYYPVGLIFNKSYKKAYCFEINKLSRKAIEYNSLINKVETSIKIFGKADESFYENLPKSIINKSTLLVDIEGAEFDILTKKVFKKFSNSIFLIELHYHLRNENDKKVEVFNKNIDEIFNKKFFTTSARDLSQFRELSKFSDNDRWLICSEGRVKLPCWVLLWPKNKNLKF